MHTVKHYIGVMIAYPLYLHYVCNMLRIEKLYSLITDAVNTLADCKPLGVVIFVVYLHMAYI